MQRARKPRYGAQARSHESSAAISGRARSWRAARSLLGPLLGALVLSACGEGADTNPEPCKQECQDRIALRGLREMLKLVYNLTLQGKPVGPQDASTACLHGGSAHVFGEASSNAEQGATVVELTYDLDHCAYLRRDEALEENYDLTLSASIAQRGTIAVQPSATTALLMQGELRSMVGTVYDPPLDYKVKGCSVELAQAGNQLSGTFCERQVGLDL